MPLPFQESCHPSHQYIAGGLKDMTNARYSEAVKADVRKADDPPGTGRAWPGFPEELGIHVITSSNEEDLAVGRERVRCRIREGTKRWSAADKFTVVLGDAGP